MLQLVIVSPSGVVSRTAVEKVSFPGEMGAFTVLQGHAPLVSGLVRGEIVYAADGREERVGIVGGFVKVCRDASCVQHFPGSPMELPYDITVKAAGG